MTESTIEAHLASIASSMETLVEENRDLRGRLDESLTRIDAQAVADRMRAAAEVQRVEADRKRTRAYRWTVGAFVVVLLVFGAALLDNQRQIEASQRKWCPVLGALITGPPSNTPRGEWIQNVFSHLFADYGCTPADFDDIPDAPTPSPSPDQS